MMMIAGSMGAYFIAYKIILSITRIVPSATYNSTNNALNLSLESIIGRFLRTFNSEIRWLVVPKVHHSGLVAILNLLILLFTVGMVIYLIKKNKKRMGRNGVLISLAILFMIPFGINAMTLISNQWHDLTIFSLFLLYVFSMRLSEKVSETVAKDGGQCFWIRASVAIVLSVIIFNNCVYSNEAYLKKELETQATLSTFTRLIDRVEQTEGYEVGETPVVLIGALDYSDITERRNGFDYSGFGLSEYYSTTYFGTYEAYIKNYLGYPINLLSEDQSLVWATDRRVETMPAFPNNGCCQLIDGVMIVKLSEGNA